MFLHLIFAAASVITPVNSQQGSDMDDSDFARYLEVHENFGDIASTYGSTFGRDCAKASAVSALTGRGFPALCIGCIVGGTAGVVSEVIFPRELPPRNNAPAGEGN